jgi:hypothetical protein
VHYWAPVPSRDEWLFQHKPDVLKTAKFIFL